MMKKIIACICALAMLLSFVPSSGIQAQAAVELAVGGAYQVGYARVDINPYVVSDSPYRYGVCEACGECRWQPLTDAQLDTWGKYDMPPGHYVLTEDVYTVQKQLNYNGDLPGSICLDLNGHTFTGKVTLEYPHVSLGEGTVIGVVAPAGDLSGATLNVEGYPCQSATAEGGSLILAVDAQRHAYQSVTTEPTCTEGGYTTYTKVAPYGAVQYATNQLKNSTDMKLKQLVAAMLNYGAAAQLYFGYNTDILANASLTDEQIALPETYFDGMVSTVPAADAAKQGIFNKISSIGI